MTKCSALSVREFFARTILLVDADQSPTETICLAWTLRNRAERMSEDGGGAGEVSLAEAEQLSRALLEDMGVVRSPDGAQTNGNGASPHPPEDGTALNRALACVSMVWDGVVADPTNGATRVHPHYEQPDWAQHCEATALIGAMLFFRAETAGTKQ